VAGLSFKCEINIKIKLKVR